MQPKRMAGPTWLKSREMRPVRCASNAWNVRAAPCVEWQMVPVGVGQRGVGELGGAAGAAPLLGGGGRHRCTAGPAAWRSKLAAWHAHTRLQALAAGPASPCSACGTAHLEECAHCHELSQAQCVGPAVAGQKKGRDGGRAATCTQQGVPLARLPCGAACRASSSNTVHNPAPAIAPLPVGVE